MSSKNYYAFLILILLTVSGFGQQGDRVPITAGKPAPEPGARTYKSAAPDFRIYHTPSPEEIRAKAKQVELDLLNGDSSRLDAPEDYYRKYAALLQDKTAALARVYPDRDCFKVEPTVSVERAEKCADSLPLLGDGSYYSFRYRSNLNQRNDGVSRVPVRLHRADIHFTGGNITVGIGDYQQGLIAEITNASFETLNKNSPELKFLKNYKPDRRPSYVSAQKNILKKGINGNGINYADSVPVKTDAFYIMRSISYLPPTGWDIGSPKQMEISRNLYDGFDIRTDSIIAFKVVGQEPDGSILLLWKELTGKEGPALKVEYK